MNEIKTATFSEIFIHDREWCRLLWEESTGRVFIASSYGCWSYCWTHIGDHTLQNFLTELDCDYMGGKMLGAAIYEHDDELTVGAIKSHILESRRDGTLAKYEARAEWEAANYYAAGDIDFHGWYDATNLCDAFEFSRSRTNPDWVNFWDRLWVPHIQATLRDETQAEQTEQITKAVT